MKIFVAMLLLFVCFVSSSALQAEDAKLLDKTVKTLEGEEINLTKYKGNVLLVVNVASKCGATPQYEALEDLYETYKDAGLVVIGFPCNQFNAQEPGSAKDIREFCEKTYGVKFPMMEKIEVNGANTTPLYKELKSIDTKPKGAGDISWNFEKFLIGRDGKVVARYATRTEPDAKEVVAAIEKELAKK